MVAAALNEALYLEEEVVRLRAENEQLRADVATWIKLYQRQDAISHRNMLLLACPVDLDRLRVAARVVRLPGSDAGV